MVRVKPPARRGGRKKADASLLCFLFVSFVGTSIILSVAWLFWEPQESIEHQTKLDAISNGSSSAGNQNDSRATMQQPLSGRANVRTGAPGNQDTSKTIGYAITITGCGKEPIIDGAAVLKHSIELASSRGPLGGKYDYHMYAIVHPAGMQCAAALKDIGYTLLERDTPVQVKDIQGDFLRERITSNGCCGEKELVKLEAYTLTQHPVVVHLDLDTLVLKPLDSLFDNMIHGPSPKMHEEVDTYWKEIPVPKQIDAFFTRDYNMVRPQKKNKPVQGGFLVLRPSMKTYQEFVDIIKIGDFRPGGGWGGVTSQFYGAMTFQGLIPYYYDHLHPNIAVELNRCVYNQMCDNPRDKKTIDEVVVGNCRDGQDDCEDCRVRPLEDIFTLHYTLCFKPWHCLPHDNGKIQHRLCRQVHREWYRIRSDLEKSWGRSGIGPGNMQTEQFSGYCTTKGFKGYIPIEQPFGSATR